MLVSVLAACQPKSKQLDLIGHWHVHYPDSLFGTWDILDSTQIIIDKNRFWGYYNAIGYWHMNTNPASGSGYGTRSSARAPKANSEAISATETCPTT